MLIKSLKKEGKGVKKAPTKGYTKWGESANRFRSVQSSFSEDKWF